MARIYRINNGDNYSTVLLLNLLSLFSPTFCSRGKEAEESYLHGRQRFVDRTKTTMKHHFLLLRHCVRSTSNEVYLGTPSYSQYLQDYVENPLPHWNVPLKWCTENALDIVFNNGAWLVDAGIVSSKDTRVEIITDDPHRDVDTATSLSLGMLDELDYDVPIDSGMDVIRTKTFMFHPEENICTFVEDGIEQQVQERLETMRRPDLSFHHAFEVVEEIFGTGKVGRLKDYLPSEIAFDYDEFSITGAANLLKHFGETLFYSKAGLHASDAFAPTAKVEQVYKLLQFHQWYRSVLNIDNNWAAMGGAAWAKVALTVLEKGYLYNRKVPAYDASDSVTIFTGHDFDIDNFATALGVTWDMPEYRTYPEFTPTPPGSGIHMLRDTETGAIQVSFVYAVYHREEHEHWRTDYRGGMREISVTWKDDDATQWNVQAIPSIQDLESHFMSRLSRFPGGAECFHATAAELNRTTPVTQPVAQPVVSTSTLSSSASNRNVVFAFAVPVALAAFLIGVSIAYRQFVRCNSRKEDSTAEPVILDIPSNKVHHVDSSVTISDDEGGELA